MGTGAEGRFAANDCGGGAGRRIFVTGLALAGGVAGRVGPGGFGGVPSGPGWGWGGGPGGAGRGGWPCGSGEG